MRKFFTSLLIVDAWILLIQWVSLFFWWFLLNNDQELLSSVFGYIALTSDEKGIILFFNPPLLIFLYYMYLHMRKKTVNTSAIRLALIYIMNFILLHSAAYVLLFILAGISISLYGV
jgi:hypothetical protein